MTRLSNEKGFTLIELSIVLVIIGIILGAVLKGQELINNAKIKRLYNMQREVAAAIYTYYDRYGVYPGDDTTASTKFTNPAVTNGNGNGLIAAGALSTAANFACAATGTEQCDLWSELRQAGFLTGSGFSNLAHSYGGTIAVSYFNMPVVGAGSVAQLTHWIHMQNVPYDVCQILDRLYDDGAAGTGSIRGTANYMTATTGVFQIGFRL